MLLTSRLGGVEGRILAGGIHGWQAAGYPLEGKDPRARLKAA